MKLLLLLSAVSAMSVCIPNEFCIHGNVSQTNIIYTVHSKFNGWNAVGWGNTMTNTPLVVVWKNGQDYMISDRRCTEKVQPLEYAPATNTTLMELFVPAPSWASTAFSFTRPLVSDNWNILKTTEYFYAAAENTPENPQNRDATIGMHSTKSLFGVVDFTVASNTNTNKKKDNGAILQLPDDWTYTKMLMIHAFMMMFAWLICPLASGFILKFFRSKSFSRYAHMGIMSIGTGLTSIFAFFVVLLYKEGGHFTSSNGSSAHSVRNINFR